MSYPFIREYLFHCVDTSESVSTEVYCSPHLCCPLRNDSGCAVAVLDLTLTKRASHIDSQYNRDINKMIKLLTSAFQQAATTNESKMYMYIYIYIYIYMYTCI